MVGGPGQEVGDVCWCWQAGGFGEGWRVVPEVFEFVGCFHFRAGGGGAEFGDGAVEEVDLVVEVDDCVVSLLTILRFQVQCISAMFSYH